MVLRGLENARLLGRAIVGNAFEQLPSPYGAYLRVVSHEEPSVYNPIGTDLVHQIIAQAYGNFRKSTPEDLLTLQWGLRRDAKIKPSRVAASIIAFTDVQGKNIIDDFFPVKEIQTFLSHIESHSFNASRPLTLPEQFAVALQITDGNPVAASLLAHSAYRAIARGKDTKISPQLAFPLEKVLRVARSTADFHTENSPTRDPLGDTYHWWATFSAGLIFTLSRETYPIQARLYTTAFYHEAALTTLVRRNMLHKTNIINHHKDVDRQGLQAGITIGNFLKN